MDLLQSLIVPGTLAHRQWASSAFEKVDNAIHDQSQRDAREQSAEDDNWLSQAYLHSDPYVGMDGSAEEGEIVEEKDIDQELLQTLLSQSSHTNEATAPPSNAFPEPRLSRLKPRRSKKLCYFWYHNGYCDRNPNNPMKPERPCEHLHSLEQGHHNAKLTPQNRRQHKIACGLQFCPLKDAEWKPKAEYEAEKRAKRLSEGSGSRPQTQHLAIASSAIDTNHALQQKKRKASFRHPDEPTPEALKMQRIVYDDGISTQEEHEERSRMCFFWYHGHCPRILDPRTNYTCKFRHRLDDPPQVVESPRGSVHSTRCGLEYCSADAKLRSQASVDTETALQNENDNRRPNSDVQTSRYSSRKKEKKTSSRVCFFWYHDACKRGTKPGESPCPMRHEMNDPPSMVEPPPGYVHREPCERELCPGDAKEQDGGDKKRYFDGHAMVENGGAELDKAGSGEEQDWYLGGFGDC